MTDPVTERLEKCYSGVVHDVMRAMGMSDFTLPREIRPVLPDRLLVGPVFTINGKVDPDSDPHQTLVEWTGLLSQAKPGHVWVSQPNDDTVAHMGELSAETLQYKGVRGMIADGAIRDVNFLIRMEFQAWGRGHTPRDIVGHWLPDGFDVPIRIGDVDIAPGDYVIGDRDGAIIIPSGRAEEVVTKAEQAIGTENLVRNAILQGVDPQEAYLTYGKF